LGNWNHSSKINLIWIVYYSTFLFSDIMNFDSHWWFQEIGRQNAKIVAQQKCRHRAGPISFAIIREKLVSHFYYYLSMIKFYYKFGYYWFFATRGKLHKTEAWILVPLNGLLYENMNACRMEPPAPTTRGIFWWWRNGCGLLQYYCHLNPTTLVEYI